MPLGDVTPNVSPIMTDGLCAQQLLRALKRAIATNKQIIARATALVSGASGGKTSINSELGSDQTEASALLDKMVALVNAHQKTGNATAVNPLI